MTNRALSWQSLMEGSPDFFVILNENRTYRDVNRTAPGITKASLLDKATPYDFIDPGEHDRVRKVNDTHGHLIGDQALKTVGHILNTTLRAADHKGRWGGEELLVVMPETTEEGAAMLADRVRERIAATEFIEQQGKVTISAGRRTEHLRQPHPDGRRRSLPRQAFGAGPDLDALQPSSVLRPATCEGRRLRPPCSICAKTSGLSRSLKPTVEREYGTKTEALWAVVCAGVGVVGLW